MVDYIPLEEVFPSPPPFFHSQVVNNQYYSWDIPLNVLAAEQLANMSPEELDNDWRLNEFFGTIAVINLPQETGRLENIKKELNAIGTYDFEVFPAINGRENLDASIWMKFKKNRLKKDVEKREKKKVLDRLHQGEAGCYMSHYLLIKRTKEAFEKALNELELAITLNDEGAASLAKNKARKYSRILILEDDNGFGIVNAKKNKSSLKDTGTIFRQALKELPTSWDMLYLMCIAQQKTEKVSDHLYQIKRSAFANAYVINHTMYNPIISILEQIEDPKVKEVLPLDKAISYRHYLYNVYAVYPSIAFQYDGVSSIDSLSKQSLTQFQPIYKSQ